MKRLMALALASAAFVATPAQAAVMFTVSGAGPFGGCLPPHPNDIGPGTCYSGDFTINIKGSAASQAGDGQLYASISGQTLEINYRNLENIVFRVDLDRVFRPDDFGPYSIVGGVGSFDAYRGYFFAGSLTGGTVTFSANPLDEIVAPTISYAVPEPATWAMMIAGFGLAGAALRRRTAIPDQAALTA